MRRRDDLLAEVDEGASGSRFRFSISGRPPFSAIMLAPKLDLQRREAAELVQHDVGDRVALELDDDAHAVAVGFVAQVGDALDALLAHELGDASRSASPC